MVGKWSAAILLGLPLATALIGLLMVLWPGRPEVTTLPWLLMFAPVWVGVMSLAFVCATGARAWLWLGSATVLSVGALWFVRLLGLPGVAA